MTYGINVAIEDYIGPFPATTDGTYWNGWATPRFTFDVACDVALAIIEDGSIAGYDPDRDAFFTLDHSSGVQESSWEAANAASELDAFEDPDPAADSQMEIAPGVYLDFWRKTDTGQYAIGAWSWVWEDYTEYLAQQFRDQLMADLTSEEWDEMERLNATPEYAGSVCASHNFIDANESMAQAFFQLFGRSPSTASDNDTAIWNAAWTIAKRDYLTAR